MRQVFHLHPCVAIMAVCVSYREFYGDLLARLQQWSAAQCLGDVFVKLCSSLRVYTNYINNYSTAVRTIDKVKSV